MAEHVQYIVRNMFGALLHGLLQVNYIHILQGCFIGTRTIWQDWPGASEATLKDMGKQITYSYEAHNI